MSCQLDNHAYTYCPRDVWSSRVTSVLAPGQVQLLASRAYLNSSSQTTCSANFTCSLCSGLREAEMRNGNSAGCAIGCAAFGICKCQKKIRINRERNGPSPALLTHLNICTYCGTFGAKSLTAQERRMVCSSAAVLSA